MGLDKKDIEMMGVAIPVVDYWEMKEEIDRLSDCVERLEKIAEVLIELYRSERVKTWEMVLEEILKRKTIKPVFRTDFESDEDIPKLENEEGA